MKNLVLGLAAALILAGFPQMAFGQCCGNCAKKGAVKKDVVANEICPVLGGKVSKDTPFTTVYEGKVIGFCCASCKEAFKKDLGKYIGKLEEELGEKEKE
ncbi:MAG: YHS domain-containing protein [Candidatus Omnitrophica bacterium]|nr:YHS domain-containing protein [Candidatus Omnitrophota bacterium]